MGNPRKEIRGKRLLMVQLLHHLIEVLNQLPDLAFLRDLQLRGKVALGNALTRLAQLVDALKDHPVAKKENDAR